MIRKVNNYISSHNKTKSTTQFNILIKNNVDMKYCIVCHYFWWFVNTNKTHPTKMKVFGHLQIMAKIYTDDGQSICIHKNKFMRKNML